LKSEEQQYKASILARAWDTWSVLIYYNSLILQFLLEKKTKILN